MNFKAPVFLCLLVICSMVFVVDGHWWWRWRRQRCRTEVTINVVSNECSRPLNYVRITSSRYFRIISSSNGVYTLRVCRLPTYLTLRRYGFQPLRVYARQSSETVTMRCRGFGCSSTTISASVTSDCNQPLQGVIFTSSELMSVSNPNPGQYILRVCSLPFELTCDRTGFETVIQTIASAAAMSLQMTCTGQNCGSTEVTLTLQSSDCQKPVSGVTVTSDDFINAVETSPGVYVCEFCGLPIDVALQKSGFDPLSVTLDDSASQTLTLDCVDPFCTADSVTVSVSSECGEALADVAITSSAIVDVNSPSAGTYELSVCTPQPTVTFEKTDFETVSQTLMGTSEDVQMTCSANCGRIQKSITIRSEDCMLAVDDAVITSTDFIEVTGDGSGIYTLDVCSLPVDITIEKAGFTTTQVSITTDPADIVLPCDGTTCSTQTVSVSVTSDCLPIVVGVIVTSSDVKAVTSPSPGQYDIEVCSAPTFATFEKIGYASLSTSIDEGTQVTLTCVVPPFITEHPQAKFRAEGEDVKLCCQAEPASAGLTYKWFKDGTEITGETNNELMLMSLTAADAGLYKCSATASVGSPPPVMSDEALLTISANPDSCANALVSRIVELAPGCSTDLGRCESRPCRSNPSSPESCSDDNICCATTSSQTITCSGVSIPVEVVVSCSCTCTAPLVTVTGTVVASDTDLPLSGITVTLTGGLGTTTTGSNGEFTFSVASTVRNLVIKAEDPNNDYNDAFKVETIPTNVLAADNVNIVMVRKAPLIQIDPSVENVLSVSGDPSQANTGPASIVIPEDAIFNADGTPYSGTVSVSLTVLDPLDPESLDIMPGQFLTQSPTGELDILVTNGVFSISFEDGSGNPLIVNDDLEVYGTAGFALWQFDEISGTWILVSNVPGRKKRQVTQQEFIGSFNPQGVSWWNIDYVYSEPDCFFKVRVFDDTFSAANEITGSIELIPTVSQVLASGTDVVKYGLYTMRTTDPRCFRIKCPSNIAIARISVAAFETLFGLSGVRVPLLPATLPDYSTGIRDVLQPTPYFYSLLENDTTTIFVNTPSASSGPFYQTIEDCSAATIDDNAFWLAKQAEFVESSFYEDFEGRCVGKAEIFLDSVMDESGFPGGDILSANLTSLSLWSDSNYGLRMAEIYEDESVEGYASCFEYRCSMQTENGSDITRISLGLSSEMGASFQCYLEGSFEGSGQPARRKRGRQEFGPMLYAPVLDPLQLPPGFFYDGMSDIQAAVDSCLADSGNYAAYIYCYPTFNPDISTPGV